MAEASQKIAPSKEEPLGLNVITQTGEEAKPMTGNEAIARGVWEAGCRVAAAYPGTPSTEILETLAKGRVRTHTVVIPEGQRASEIADRLATAGLAERDAFLAVILDPETPIRLGVEGSSLEGYLYPDTYRFARALPPEPGWERAES